MRESVQGRRFGLRFVDAKIVINWQCCHPTPGLGKKEFSVRRSDQKLEKKFKKVTLDENSNSGPPILVTFGLQPIALSDSLKKWSLDLYEVFTFIQTKKPYLKVNELQIVTELFNKTLHNCLFARVRIGTVQNFLVRSNTTLNLVVLTWLQQL
jgi:hypothetical protein